MGTDNKKKVLTVDDDEFVREILAAYLEDSGFEVLQAENGRLGLEAFRQEKPDLVMLDLRMPEMDGLEVLGYITKESPDTPVILVSGMGTIGDAIKALKLGAWDYIAKPIHDMGVLEHAVNKALERSEFLEEKKRYSEQLEEKVKSRTAEVEQRRLELEKALAGTIKVVASTVEVRDPYTAGHQRRVATLARAIAQEMELPKHQVEGIYMAGVVHDLGKIYVPAEILSKPSKLNDIEFNLIRTHSQVGYDLLKTINFPWPIAEIVHQHHERLNGSGYPQGLSSDQILLEAKIICVADVVEAMASHRPYRPARGVEMALEHIKEESGTLFEPEVVDVCLQLFNEKEFEFD